MDGHPRFGMLYVPATGELFATTGKDSAAWTTLPVGTDLPEFEKLAWKSLSGRVPNPADLVAVESRSHRSPETEMLLAEKGVIARALKIGSALKFGVLARGDADLYLRLGATGEWDTAAGQAIVEAAGGLVTDLDGDSLFTARRPNASSTSLSSPGVAGLARLRVGNRSATEERGCACRRHVSDMTGQPTRN